MTENDGEIMKPIMFLFTFFMAISLFAENNQYLSDSIDQENYIASIRSWNRYTVQVINHPRLGPILTDSNGMTLYRFTPDKNNVSVCYEACAKLWPPLLMSSGRPILAPGIIGNLGTTRRGDNTQQVTYNGMPLYFFAEDKKPGDANGQNLENKWFVVNPSSSFRR